RKRKRDAQDEQAGNDDEEENVSDIDYFAPKKPATETAPTDAEQDTPKKRKVKLLDEDECRQILRSHRLKFTVLVGGGKQADTKAETGAEVEAEDKKKKKKKKEKEKEERKSKKHKKEAE